MKDNVFEDCLTFSTDPQKFTFQTDSSLRDSVSEDEVYWKFLQIFLKFFVPAKLDHTFEFPIFALLSSL